MNQDITKSIAGLPRSQESLFVAAFYLCIAAAAVVNVQNLIFQPDHIRKSLIYNYLLIF